jgi:hypothetical protein
MKRAGVRGDNARRAPAGRYRERFRRISRQLRPREDVKGQRWQEQACPERHL